ncbi:MAG TPA: pyrroloquinoline quinone biosynthesis peptide chaperone PqqD [Verrucomicrobiae bacterium]|nr:pyrroloquinoline quinone biosynthesis peptide chaperone PqqD [Verrucomicrobiae bacterium]
MQLPSADMRPKLSARARLQTDKVTGKPVLLYPEGVLMLNPTGHAIASLCTGEMTFQEIVVKLAERYKISAEQISPQVADYLNRLREKNLLETQP